jgi:hypothetical protein
MSTNAATRPLVRLRVVRVATFDWHRSVQRDLVFQVHDFLNVFQKCSGAN